ncbi:bacteriophage antitermination protein Q, partial [Xenorhabdus bovienii]|nr:bacteriophage antitermination protein Q [Xenorhabdus bovienii]
AWIQYCYAYDLNFDYQISICQNVYQRFLSLHERYGMKKMSSKTATRVRQLIWLAVQESVGEFRDDFRREFSYSDLSRQIGISPSNWNE